MILSPFAGQNRNRSIESSQIEIFAEKYGKRVTYVGSGRKCNIKSGIDLIDKISFIKLIDLICSANVVISPEGFVVYFAGMAGKKVFCHRYNVAAINERAHPSWNIKLFDDLKELDNEQI